MSQKEFEEMLFPYDDVRPIQEDLIRKINECVTSQQNLVVHAPTGLGKTAAALAPCINEALKKDLTVFFLTSRHTQHKIAMDTVEHIKKKHKLKIHSADIIGKKGLCLQPDIFKLPPRDFADFCQKMRDDDLCEFYANTRQKSDPTVKAQMIVNELKESGKTDTESIMAASQIGKMCPYEIAILLAKDARVIVGDYYYIFHPSIRESFLRKCSKDLSKSIIIVDEGHNLPDRIKDLATSRINSIVVSRAIEEAKKNGNSQISLFLKSILDIIDTIGQTIPMNGEKYLTKEQVLAELDDYDIDNLIEQMDELSGKIREEQRQSYIGSVSGFLSHWLTESEGFTRIASKTPSIRGEVVVTISYRCLDPSIITREVIRGAYSTILMSGTLTPTGMYREILGFDSSQEVTFKSPFPETNKLNIIIPKTTTKFENRNSAQYQEIAQITAKVTNAVTGNCAVFFPSYQLKDEVYEYYVKASDKTVFSEKAKMTKSEKLEFLEKFKQYKDAGAVLFGVIAGNFSEGVDLPGDYLKGVVIVGLPLQRPDLETEALIKYYDTKFSKGWDYGYLLPAFNKTLQSAGRCIRTETDKGIIVFLDERYSWKNYFRCFPPSWDIKITLLYERLIHEFFSKNS